MLAVSTLDYVLHTTRLISRVRLLNISRLCSCASKMEQHSDSNFISNLDKLSKQVAPPLTNTYKGQAGKIGVIGGSFEYTGAPYFAAVSALKVGADLAHVFCSRDAAIPIKCYSPELIVHPLLDPAQFGAIKEWIKRLDVILIGPGLGRNEGVFTLIEDIICHLKECAKPLIIDADGLFLITKKPELLNGFQSHVILTPNKMELARLLKLDNPSMLNDADPQAFMSAQNWSEYVTILSKGSDDEIITRDRRIVLTDLGGSGRRCGGQGDVLGGALSVFMHWSRRYPETRNYLAIYAACKLTRQCNAKAFARNARSMTAGDMIEEIHNVFNEFFELK